MNEKELYQQKKQARLDEWKAEVDKLKAKAEGASADAQLELKKEIKAVEIKIEEGNSRLNEIAGASDEAWEALKDGVNPTWDSMQSAFDEALSKFKK